MQEKAANQCMKNSQQVGDLRPANGLSPVEFALELEARGACETVIIQRVRQHFAMALDEVSAVREALSAARLKEVEFLMEWSNWRDDGQLAKKVIANLAVSPVVARDLITEVRETK